MSATRYSDMTGEVVVLDTGIKDVDLVNGAVVTAVVRSADVVESVTVGVETLMAIFCPMLEQCLLTEHPK